VSVFGRLTFMCFPLCFGLFSFPLHSVCAFVGPINDSYTCILYLNDNDWNVDTDGGALRLYPNTQHVFNPSEVVASRRFDFVDIAPKNGRLLIFDSRLVHSVEKVTSTHRRRRALTLWINRLNDSGVRGEMYENKM
jgi:Rps23 Pro-64 3,4-dihydroxylase Tpa1-like proline 4-hydroxylase